MLLNMALLFINIVNLRADNIIEIRIVLLTTIRCNVVIRFLFDCNQFRFKNEITHRTCFDVFYCIIRNSNKNS